MANPHCVENHNTVHYKYIDLLLLFGAIWRENWLGITKESIRSTLNWEVKTSTISALP